MGEYLLSINRKRIISNFLSKEIETAPGGSLNEKRRKEIVERARELGEKYLEKYEGCAQATFTAVCEAVELDYSEDSFKSLIGLSGGVGGLGTGTCGAVAGGAAAISLSLDLGREKLEKDPDKRWKIYRKVSLFGKKFREKYKEIPCRKVQMELYGMSFNLLDEEAWEIFEELSKCEKVVADSAGWAAELILQPHEK